MRRQAMVDPKALKILFDTYWSSSGWKPNPTTAKEELDYAVAAGVMFPEVWMDHNEVVTRARKQCKSVDKDRVAAAFLVSLRTRRLELRSALGSYAVARRLRKHAGNKFLPSLNCSVCYTALPKIQYDLNIFNFERFKWGGVRHLRSRLRGI